MVEHIEIIQQIVEGLVHTVKIKSVDNASGTESVLSVCNTYYLNSCDKIITVEGTEYEITAFVINTSLTLKPLDGVTLIDPALTEFDIPSPTFYSGTPIATSEEKTADDLPQGPYFWILEIFNILPPENKDSSLVRSTAEGVNIFLLDDTRHEDWNTADHRTNVINPMKNEWEFIFKAFDKMVGVYFGELEKARLTEHADFGKYVIDKGYRGTILTERLSGIQAVMDFPFTVEPCDVCDAGPVEVCGPVELIVNGESYGETPSGLTKTLTIQDQDTNPVLITKIDDNTGEVSVGGDPVTTDVNGTPTGVDTPGGANLDINVVDLDDNPVGTLITNTATEKKIQVTVAGAVYYNRPQPVFNTSFLTYDEGWHYINGTYALTIPSNGILQSLDSTDWYKIVHDVELYGHFYRFVGLNAGYYNSDTDTYHLADGTLSDRATVFTADRYIFDRLTGLAWRETRGGAGTLTTGLNAAAAATWNGFNNWYLPTLDILLSIINFDKLSLYSVDNPIFDIQLNQKTATLRKGQEATQGWYMATFMRLDPSRSLTIQDAISFVRVATAPVAP